MNQITTIAPSTIPEFQKSQNIRLVDVFLLGPFLIYASTYKTLPNWVRALLLLIGIATILYNGHNYLQNQSK